MLCLALNLRKEPEVESADYSDIGRLSPESEFLPPHFIRRTLSAESAESADETSSPHHVQSAESAKSADETPNPEST
jgi:hypothetical protein